jgi:TonB family protein
MKTKVFFLVCMLAAVSATSQERELQEIEITPPSFGGEFRLSIAEFLKQNVVYPDQSVRWNEEGTEVVDFTVTKEGKLTDFNIINSVSREIDQEIIRVLQFTSGNWLPGTLDGVPVDMRKEISVEFKLDPSKDFVELAKYNLSKGNEFLFIKNKPQKALKYFNRGINYLPNDDALMAMRSLCKYKLGDMKGASSDWNRLKVLAQRNGKTVNEPIYALETDADVLQEFISGMNLSDN